MAKRQSPYMTTDQVAEYLGLSVATIKKWRVERIGPPFTKIVGGRSVRYRREDVDAYMLHGRTSWPIATIDAAGAVGSAWLHGVTSTVHS